MNKKIKEIIQYIEKQKNIDTNNVVKMLNEQIKINKKLNEHITMHNQIEY